MTKSLKASFRKSIVGIVMMTTIFSLSGVAALVPTAQAATFVTGDLVRNPSAAGMAQFDVYVVKVVGTKMFKRLILSPAIFNSYGGLFKWSDIKTVSTDEMNAFKTSGMVRIETGAPVFAVAPVDGSDVGSKSWLNVSADTFIAAGGDWDAIYTINTLDGAGYSAAQDLTTQAQVSTYLTTGVLPGVVVPPVVGALNVALSADTPATTTVISTQAAADFLHFTLTGTGTVTGVSLKRTGISADASLSNVYLFDGNTRLTDAASVSAGSVINFTNASGLFTVTGSRTISVKADMAATAGETIAVQLTGITMTAGTIGGTLPVSGNTMSVATATLAGAAFGTVSPSSTTINPANDVLVWQSTLTVTTRDVNMTRMALREIGSINYSDVNNFRLFVDGVQVAQTQNLDTNGYVTFSLATPKLISTGSRVVKVMADVISGSTRTLSLSLRNKADIGLSDSNYGVGVSVTSTLPATAGTLTIATGSLTVAKTTDSPAGNVTLNGSDVILAKYTFTAFGEPVKVETLTPSFVYVSVSQRTATLAGASGTASLTIGGTAVSTAFATDLTTTAANLVTAINANATTGALVSATSAAAVITLVDKAVTPVVVTDSSTTLTATVAANTFANNAAASAATLRNGRLMLNGAQVGSTTTLLAAGTAFTTNFVVTPGTPATVEVRADVYDNNADASGAGAMHSGDTVVVSMAQGSSNGQGQVSSTTLNVPTAVQAANTITVAAGSISLSKQTNYASQSTVVPQTAYKIAAYNVTGNSTEDVNVDTISVTFAAGDQFAVTKLSNVYVLYGGVRESSTKATVTAAANTWSVSHTLAKNASVPVEIYADIATMTVLSDDDTMIATATISGTTASSAQAASTAATAGQTITAKAGTVSVAQDASSLAASNIDDNQTLAAAAFKVTTVNDKYTITKVIVTPAASTSIANVILKDGTTVLGTLPATGSSVTFGGLSVVVNPNTSKVLTVDLQLGSVGTGAGTSAENVKVTLTQFDTVNSVGTVASNTDAPAGNNIYVFKSVPTITNVTLPSGTLATGTVTLAKVSVSSSGSGTVGWKKIVFTSSKTADPTIANASGETTGATAGIYDADTGLRIAGAMTIAGLSGGAGSGSFTFVATNEQEISGSKTYVLKATVGGTLTANTESIITNIADGDIAAHAKSNYAAVALTNASFVWSDQSVSPHDAVATSADWNNNYLVKNIPTDTQRLAN